MHAVIFLDNCCISVNKYNVQYLTFVAVVDPGNAHFISMRQVTLPVEFRYFASYCVILVCFTCICMFLTFYTASCVYSINIINQQDNVRTNTESVQCHHVFDIVYLAPTLRGHVTSSIT